ncbi:MAG: PilZ domain-containing protein [Proteobacteria bacterium]|nr:PilZ domain-containing protein [Pseudomonadota bacterium]
MTSDEQRSQAPRVKGSPIALRIKLRYSSVDEFVELFASNVNEKGIFLASKTPRPVGTEVHVELRLDDDHPVLSCRGLVRWTRQVGARGEPGMGIEFVEVAPETRPILQRIGAVRATLGVDRHTIPKSHEERGNGKKRVSVADLIARASAAVTDDPDWSEAQLAELLTDNVPTLDAALIRARELADSPDSNQSLDSVDQAPEVSVEEASNHLAALLGAKPVRKRRSQPIEGRSSPGSATVAPSPAGSTVADPANRPDASLGRTTGSPFLPRQPDESTARIDRADLKPPPDRAGQPGATPLPDEPGTFEDLPSEPPPDASEPDKAPKQDTDGFGLIPIEEHDEFSERVTVANVLRPDELATSEERPLAPGGTNESESGSGLGGGGTDELPASDSIADADRPVWDADQVLKSALDNLTAAIEESDFEEDEVPAELDDQMPAELDDQMPAELDDQVPRELDAQTVELRVDRAKLFDKDEPFGKEPFEEEPTNLVSSRALFASPIEPGKRDPSQGIARAVRPGMDADAEPLEPLPMPGKDDPLGELADSLSKDLDADALDPDGLMASNLDALASSSPGLPEFDDEDDELLDASFDRLETSDAMGPLSPPALSPPLEASAQKAMDVLDDLDSFGSPTHTVPEPLSGIDAALESLELEVETLDESDIVEAVPDLAETAPSKPTAPPIPPPVPAESRSKNPPPPLPPPVPPSARTDRSSRHSAPPPSPGQSTPEPERPEPPAAVPQPIAGPEDSSQRNPPKKRGFLRRIFKDR